MVPRATAAVAVALCIGAVGPFLVDVGEAAPEPVAFDDTVTGGGVLEDRYAVPDRVTVPKAQVFYSRYRYVVGYYGVDAAVIDVGSEHRRQQFGAPHAVYVTDFSGTSPSLTDRGYPVPERSVGWTEAREATYVVDSEARLPSGATVVPFSDADDARSFVSDYGGRILDWDQLGDRDHVRDPGTVARESVEQRDARGDRLVGSTDRYRERPVSVVVGENASTIAEAVDRAPPDTTVYVPPGTYDEHVELDRPLTLYGPDAVVSGDGNGTVIEVTADDAAVVGPTIEGVGNRTRNPDAVDPDAWDHNVESGYGHGDAGISVVDATGALVADVTIETPANGVLLRDAPEAVVTDVSIDGTREWRDGFMGVVAMRSPGVVQRSSFDGGRDGVYAHRSDGLVVRDNAMADARYGVHLMYTSNALIVDNRIRDQELGGITIMTGPQSNALVGNWIRDSQAGIATSGTHHYVAGNVLANNRRGLGMASPGSIYEGNTVLHNDVGIRTSEVVPTSRVVGNDVVDNDLPVSASAGPLRIWSDGERGNYWSRAPTPLSGGDLDRAFVPTDPVDASITRTDGARTLSRAPAVRGLRELLGSIPGLRSGEVVDHEPLTSPTNREAIESEADPHPAPANTTRDDE